jgi:hypothetical protein
MEITWITFNIPKSDRCMKFLVREPLSMQCYKNGAPKLSMHLGNCVALCMVCLVKIGA